MTLTVLYIRLKQLQRELNGLGFYVFIITGIIVYVTYIFFKQFEKQPNAFYLIAAITLFCIILQIYRTDKSFIYKHINRPHLQLFSEYIALTLPFCISCIFTKNWFYYPLLLALLFCVPYIKLEIKHRTIFKNLSSIFPASNFEWISGCRKNYISFITLYSLAAGFCWFRVLPLILLWLLTSVITTFHNECESIQILREDNKVPDKFLLNKLFINGIYMLIVYAPLLVINTIFNFEFLFINILFLFVQISLLSFAICLKYSAYKPNKNHNGNTIPLAIVSFSSLLPYLLPIPIIFSVVYFVKGTNNLKQYLND